MTTYAGTSSGTTPGVTSTTSGTNTANAIVATQSNASGGNSAISATNSAGGNNLGSAIWCTCNTALGYGVHATNTNTDGVAVLGTADGDGATAVNGTTAGGITAIAVLGTATGAAGIGVYGKATHHDGFGVYGLNSGSTSNAVGTYGSGWNFSVFAEKPVNASGAALYANGFVTINGGCTVVGILSAGTKDFKIDHPLDPANMYLRHSSVESPDRKNVYDGVVETDKSGEAVVTLPAYFEALNSDFRYQLTAIGGAAPDLHVKSELKKGNFVIGGAKAKQRISWQVTGIRQDAHAKANPLIVEQAKAKEHKGFYLHPTDHGVAEEKGIEHGRVAGVQKNAENVRKGMEAREKRAQTRTAP